MSEILEAVAESLIGHVKNEDVETIETILRTVNDDVMWRDVITHELNLTSLMSGLLDSDILLPRLAIFDICTMSPLHYAALRGADVVVDLFLKAGRLPVDSVLRSGSTPLQLACFAGVTDVARLLIEHHHAKINQKDKYGWTALHYASLGGQMEAVELLVAQGADVSMRDKDGTTAAFRAQAYGRDDIVSVLLESTGDGDQLLIDDSTADPVPIYSTIKRVEASAASVNATAGNATAGNASADVSSTNVQESEYEVGVQPVPPKQWDNTDFPGHVYSDLVNEPTYSITTKSQVDNKEITKSQNEANHYTISAGTEVNPDKGHYSTFEIGNNTMTNILREEFLKFRAQKLSTQKRKPRPSILLNDSESEPQDETTFVNKDYEEIGVYAELMKVNEVCKMADRQISASMPSLSYNSDARSDSIWSSLTLPSRQNASSTAPPPLPPPRNPDKIRVRPTQPDYYSFDKSRLILILEKIEHNSAMMEAAFGALADKLESPDDWKTLAYALPLRTNPKRIEKKISEIEKKFPANVRRQTVELLRQWRNHRGEGATVQSLSTAMSNCGLVNLLQHVVGASQEFSA